MLCATFLISAMLLNAQEPKLDFYALLQASPEQVERMIGHHVACTMEFKVDRAKPIVLPDLLKNSVSQTQNILGPGRLVSATYLPKSVALKRALVQIAFGKPENGFVSISALGPGYTWKMVMAAFGIATGDVAFEREPNYPGYKFRMPDPRLKGYKISGFEQALGGPGEEVVNNTEIQFAIGASVAEKQASAGTQKSLRLSVDYREGGAVSVVWLTGYGTEKLTLAELVKAAGIPKESYHSEGLPEQPYYDPGSKHYKIVVSDARLKGWEITVAIEKTGSSLMVERDRSS